MELSSLVSLPLYWAQVIAMGPMNRSRAPRKIEGLKQRLKWPYARAAPADDIPCLTK